MSFDKCIIGALRVCTTKEQIEDTFNLFHVTNIKRKQQYLLMAMDNPHVFFTPEMPSVESSYFFIVEQFMSGNWRYAAQLKQGLEILKECKKTLNNADVRLLEKLSSCQSQDDIDRVFNAEHINGLENRIAALRRVMQATVLHSIPAEIGETLADDYAFECAVFLEGSWRSL